MDALLVALGVICGTLIWLGNRRILDGGGRAVAFGFWVALSGAVISGILALALGQPLDDPVVWGLGALVALGYGVGYCLIAMHCLRIGPAGPTVAMNNMGLVWPVALGALWLQPRPFTNELGAGLVLVLGSLIAFAFNRPTDGNPANTRSVSLRWLIWAVLCWVLSGLCMTGQLVASIHDPAKPLALICAFNCISAAILAAAILRLGQTQLRGNELIFGSVNGALQVAIAFAVLTVLPRLGPELVLPFVIAGPAVIMLLLARVLYRERLSRTACLACTLGVAGLVALSLAMTK